MALVVALWATVPPFRDAASQQRSPATAVVAIGLEDGPASDVFASISDLGVLPDGGVVILDGMAKRIRWFDLDGRFRAGAGREGGGPGEFRNPSAMVVTSTGLVHVLDNQSARIGVFRAVDGKLVHVRDRKLPFPSADLCVLGDRVFLLSIGQRLLVHEIDSTGREVRAFGERLQPPASVRRGFNAAGLRMLDESFNRGHIACDATNDVVVLVQSAQGDVRAFMANGRMRWHARLEGTTSSRIGPTNGGSGMESTWLDDTRISRAPVDVTLERDGTVVISMIAIDYRNGVRDAEASYEERRLRSLDGQIVSTRLARGSIAAVHAGRRYASRYLPFPTAIIY